MVATSTVKDQEHKVQQLEERVAELERHEQNLRQHTLLLRVLMDQVPEGIVIVDAPDLKLRFVSIYALHTIGRSLEEMQDTTGFFSHNLVVDPDGTPIDADELLLRRVIENGEVVKNREIIVERPDGSRIPLLCNAAPVYNESETITGTIMSYMDVTERRRMEKELKQTHEELEAMVQQLCQQTVRLKRSEAHLRQLSLHLLEYQENERKRVANEIHDSAGQVLAAIKYRIESALLKLQKTGVEETLQPVKDLIPVVQACIDDMRRLQMALRPSVLDDMGLVAAVEWFFRDFQKTYPAITPEGVLAVNETQIPDSLKLVMFRIVQEALTNVGKHSDAETVRITLQESADTLVLTIEDDGRGFEVEEAQTLKAFGRGLGLSSMRERVQSSGGTLTIESAPSHGTQIKAMWPKAARTIH